MCHKLGLFRCISIKRHHLAPKIPNHCLRCSLFLHRIRFRQEFTRLISKLASLMPLIKSHHAVIGKNNCDSQVYWSRTHCCLWLQQFIWEDLGRKNDIVNHVEQPYSFQLGSSPRWTRISSRVCAEGAPRLVRFDFMFVSNN